MNVRKPVDYSMMYRELTVVVMEAELAREQRISCLQKAATEKPSKKELLEMILNGAFSEESIDETDKTSDGNTNPVLVITVLSVFRLWHRHVAERRGHFPYLQEWLGSS